MMRSQQSNDGNSRRATRRGNRFDFSLRQNRVISGDRWSINGLRRANAGIAKATAGVGRATGQAICDEARMAGEERTGKRSTVRH